MHKSRLSSRLPTGAEPCEESRSDPTPTVHPYTWNDCTGDGAYDRDDVYREVCQRHPDAAVIVPPRSSAVPSATAEIAPTKRDRHLQLIAERGRMGWQRASGYNWRAWWRPISAATSE